MAVGGTDHTPTGETPTSRPQGRRRLDPVLTSPTSTIVISDAQFNAKGSPSSATEAGVTTITVTSTDGGEVHIGWASGCSFDLSHFLEPLFFHRFCDLGAFVVFLVRRTAQRVCPQQGHAKHRPRASSPVGGVPRTN